MLVKKLVQHGNSKAIVIDKAILLAAGLDENSLFQITIDPNSGITIQSVKPLNDNLFTNSLNKVLKKHDKLFKRLADR
jgi:antitoxin component of MazEF toxin-antitoxin module